MCASITAVYDNCVVVRMCTMSCGTGWAPVTSSPVVLVSCGHHPFAACFCTPLYWRETGSNWGVSMTQRKGGLKQPGAFFLVAFRLRTGCYKISVCGML